MTLTESINTCFQKSLDFKGRAGMPEFWGFFLFCFVSSIIMSLVPILGQLYVLALFIPCLAVSVRRLHDTGRSAWWLLLFFLLFPIAMLGFAVSAVILLAVAFVGVFGSNVEGGTWMALMLSVLISVGCLIPPLILCAQPGTVGPNRYGPDPLNPAPDVGGSVESS